MPIDGDVIRAAIFHDGEEFVRFLDYSEWPGIGPDKWLTHCVRPDVHMVCMGDRRRDLDLRCGVVGHLRWL